ncbi:MAG TPA: hypothetical protein VMU82_14530 [Acetobacteraceae bacterium]|nr:hypothetical protein [Acetobacteraceae bacterium]
MPILCAIVLVLAGSPQAAADCPAMADLAADAVPLPHVQAAIRAGRLDILAVGAPNMVRGYPAQMVARLRAQQPGLSINLRLRTRRGMTVAGGAVTIRRGLVRRKAALVLWQTGTVEALDNVDPAGFQDRLAEVAADAAGQGADLILIEPRFSRFLVTETDLQPYLDAMQTVALLPGVALFHRFELTQDWADTPALDLDAAGTRARRLAVVHLLNVCVGRALARMVIDGIR